MRRAIARSLWRARRIACSTVLLLLALAAAIHLTAARSASAGTGATRAPGEARTPGTPAVGLRTLRLVDRARLARPLHGRPRARSLVVVLRYPAQGAPGALDVPFAPVDPLAGGRPLIVFAHGFAETPAVYSQLLQSWARAGFVVAAPVFPLESADAPGGPDEADVVNEPADMSFVISQLLSESAAGGEPLSGLIDPSRIAVAGQSDGGEAALAVADARRMRDPRVRAAVVMSGAEMSGIGGYDFIGGPALLALQGTADTSNEPRYTYRYYRAAQPPKYLVRLLGAGHLPPYTSEQPQLGIVERLSTTFLEQALSGATAGVALARLGDVAGVAELSGSP